MSIEYHYEGEACTAFFDLCSKYNVPTPTLLAYNEMPGAINHLDYVDSKSFYFHNGLCRGLAEARARDLFARYLCECYTNDVEAGRVMEVLSVLMERDCKVSPC